MHRNCTPVRSHFGEDANLSGQSALRFGSCLSALRLGSGLISTAFWLRLISTVVLLGSEACRFNNTMSIYPRVHQSVICQACDISQPWRGWFPLSSLVFCFCIASAQREMRTESDGACGRGQHPSLCLESFPMIPQKKVGFSALPSSRTFAITTKAVCVFCPRAGLS